MEATGYSRWFERLQAELGFEVWIGDPAEIQARRVKKQKTYRKDPQLLLKLMLEDRFPQIWVPSPENRDVRQLLWHRHRLVQMRTRIMNQLQALAMNEGWRWKSKLWSEQGRAELDKLALAPWASRRRRELLELLDRMNPTIEELTAAAEQEAQSECSYVASQKRVQSHAATVWPSSGSRCRSSRSQKAQTVSLASYNTTFSEQTYIRWCCIDSLRPPRLSPTETRISSFGCFVALKFLPDRIWSPPIKRLCPKYY
jgi:transposase